MASRYWVAGSTNNWSDTSNWSTTSGGVGGASVPGAADDAIFDTNSASHNCTLDQNVNVNSWTYPTSGYGGTIDCVTFDVTTAGNLWGRAGATLYMGSGTFNVGGSFSGRDGNLYGQTATLRFTTLNGGLSLSNTQKDNGPNLVVASGAKCVYYFSGNRDVRSFDCYGEFNYQSAGLEVFGDVTIRSTGSLTNTTGQYIRIQTTSNPTCTLEAGASVGDTAFTTHRANPSSTSSLTFTGAGWATATGVSLQLNYQTNTTGRWTYVFPSSMNVRHVQIQPRYNSSQATFDFSTNSTQLTVQEGFYYSGTRTTDNFDVIVGSSALTFALTEDSTFSPRGNTFPPIIIGDNAAGTLTLDSNVTTPYVHDCGNHVDENGYTVTTTGTDPSPCSTGARYWVGLVDTDYENTGNWSTSSGGLGNASVPVGTNDVILDSGSSTNCIMTASRSVASFDAQSGYTGAIDFSSSSMRCAGNFTLDHGGGMDFGSGTHYMGGFFDVRDCGTLDYATSSVELAGTGTDMLTWSSTDTLKSFYDVIVSGNLTTNNVPYAAIRATNSYTISGTLTHDATSAARVTKAESCPLVVSGTLAGVGVCTVSTGASGVGSLTISGSGSVTISTLRMSLGGVTGSYVGLGGGDYSSCDVEMSTSNSSSDAPLRFLGDVTLKSLNFTTSSGGTIVLDSGTYDTNITLKGDLTCTTSNVSWSAGTGTIILDNVISQSIDFNGQTVEGIHVTDASTGSIVLANNFSTAWLRDCNGLIDLNGYTITNADTEDRCAYPYDPPTTIALDSSHAINTDLGAWWPLLDGTGNTATNLVSGGNVLEADGAAKFGKFSRRGNFADMEQSANCVFKARTSTDPNLTAGNFTASIWFERKGRNASTQMYPFAWSGGGPTDVVFKFSGQYVSASGSTYTYNLTLLSSDGSSTTSTGAASYNSDEWVHAVGTWDGSNLTLYKNGVLVDSVSFTTLTTNPYNGISVGGRRAYNTTQGEVYADYQNARFWNRALTSTEVASLYSDPWIGSDYTGVVPLTNRYFAPAAFRRLG